MAGKQLAKYSLSFSLHLKSFWGQHIKKLCTKKSCKPKAKKVRKRQRDCHQNWAVCARGRRKEEEKNGSTTTRFCSLRGGQQLQQQQQQQQQWKQKACSEGDQAKVAATTAATLQNAKQFQCPQGQHHCGAHGSSSSSSSKLNTRTSFFFTDNNLRISQPASVTTR